jgi:hypothetical protein
MPLEPVANDHHVARHCKGTQLREDGTPGPGAFICDDWDGISCNWLEHFAGNMEDQLAGVRAVVASRRTVTGSHRLAVLNVGAVRARAAEKLALSLAVVKDPLPEEGGKPPDPSHALIEQVAEAARTALGELLASCVIRTTAAKK